MAQCWRYAVASLITYSWTFLGTYLFTERVNISPDIAYLVSITIAYAMTYLLNALYVFRHAATAQSAARFLLHACLFWILNNALYSLLYRFTAVDYRLLVLVNVAVFSAFRFASMKWLVFG